MTIEERLAALRESYTVERAAIQRRFHARSEPQFWALNALMFDWHRKPTKLAVVSYRYALRLERERRNAMAPA